jgi:bifunctional UDP-N-acetylglucosamine pyrophosphorylase/glucosamine-1-phosphate N-acetyltransferase
MKELTEDTPKPLLMVDGKTLLHHKLAELPGSVDEVILVIGYHGDKIRDAFGDEAEGKKIRYAVYEPGETLDGTGGALWKAKDMLSGRFLVLMGDDLYGREDLELAAEVTNWTIGVAEASAGGKMVFDEQGNVIGIEEGKRDGKVLTSTNLFGLDTRIFEYPLVPKAEGSSEYGLPQTVLAASKASGIPLAAQRAMFWFQVTAPEDLVPAGEALRARKQ